NGCLRLIGSVACPGFSYAYLNPGNLSNAFPFFAGVKDVASFDAGALDYFSNQFEFQTTKFIDELGCSNATNAVIRWERTVLCSSWVNEMWSTACLANYNGSAAATSQKMVCQSTCLEYSASEVNIVNSTMFCPGTDNTNGNRSYNLNKDFVDCTNWTTLATNNSMTCVEGTVNEPNCGFGSSSSQLCAFCNSSTPESCCYSSIVCGYTLVPQSSTTGSSSSSTAGASQTGSSASSGSGLSGGQIAGIVIGSVLGGLLLLGLLIFLLCARRRRDRKNSSSNSSFAAGTPHHTSGGVFGGIFHNEPPHGATNSSEKGLLGHSAAAHGSSPTMGGEDTLYSGHKGSNEGSSMMAGGSGGAAAGVGAGGLAPGGQPGERTSGVVLPRVRDENQGGDRWIETGNEVSVLWPYQASLPDELDLRPGMKLKVLRLYDDAWGTAQVVSALSSGEGSEVGKQGAFPIVCVSEGSSFG
ncbi:hypothetical protein BCR39DRAFT_448703, partial [Naematelia encephala]